MMTGDGAARRGLELKPSVFKALKLNQTNACTLYKVVSIVFDSILIILHTKQLCQEGFRPHRGMDR
jgi:hypothetical protein